MEDTITVGSHEEAHAIVASSLTRRTPLLDASLERLREVQVREVEKMPARVYIDLDDDSPEGAVEYLREVAENFRTIASSYENGEIEGGPYATVELDDLVVGDTRGYAATKVPVEVVLPANVKTMEVTISLTIEVEAGRDEYDIQSQYTDYMDYEVSGVTEVKDVNVCIEEQ